MDKKSKEHECRIHRQNINVQQTYEKNMLIVTHNQINVNQKSKVLKGLTAIHLTSISFRFENVVNGEDIGKPAGSSPISESISQCGLCGGQHGHIYQHSNAHNLWASSSPNRNLSLDILASLYNIFAGLFEQKAGENKL